MDELGGVAADGPRPLTVVVSTRFVPDTDWDPVSLTGSRALLSLTDNPVVARTRSRRTLAIVAGPGDCVTSLVGPRGGATARRILARREELLGVPTARDRAR